MGLKAAIHAALALAIAGCPARTDPTGAGPPGTAPVTPLGTGGAGGAGAGGPKPGAPTAGAPAQPSGGKPTNAPAVGTRVSGHSATVGGASPALRGVLLEDGAVRSRLDANDPVLEDGSYFEEWTFEATAGTRVRFEMRSQEIDSFLMLFGPDGEILVGDDDGGSNRDARITMTLANAGVHRLRCNTFGSGAHEGAYTLTVAEAPVERIDLRSLTAGRRHGGRLGPGDRRTPQGAFYDDWTFEGASGRRVVLELNSATLDTTLTLLGPRGERVAFDDDGGGNLNSRLSATLPSGGRYSVRCSTFARDAQGDYVVSLQMW